MQGQYEKLLREIDDAKRDAQVKVYKTFQDDAPVVPPAREGEGTNRGLSAEGGTGTPRGAKSPQK